MVHVRRGVHTNDASRLRLDDSARVPDLEEGKQYKFLGVLESVIQEDRLSLECAAKEYLRRMSIIWTSPLSDHNRVTASNQFALPLLSYLMWTQHWPLTELRKIDREARKIIVENGGKHPCGSTSILYLPREKGGRGLRSVEQEYQVTKVKVAVKLYRNDDQAMKMVRKFEERAEELGHQSLVKDAAKCAEEFRIQLKLKDPELTCLSAESGDVIPAKKLKAELRAGLVSKLQKEVHSQKWQGKFLSAREEDEDLNFEGCFWWLSGWQNCPTHTVAGMFELYEQLLPTRLYASQKMGTDLTGVVTCRLCDKVPESVPHVLAGCTAMAQNKYLTRHNAALKTIFFEIVYDLGLIASVPPWYSPVKPKPVYESDSAEAFWDVPVFAVHEEVTANRVDARIIDHQTKRVITLEMSCPWITNRTKKTAEKTLKYGPLRWELKQQYQGYEVRQYNIIMDVLGGWSRDLDVTMKELVGSRSKRVLQNMQKAVLSGSLNIARTFKVAT